MLEYGDVAERRAALGRLVGVEDQVYVRVGEGERCYAIADEDLERATEEKTSSVHFMRFELSDVDAAAVRSGAPIIFGADHENLTCEVTLNGRPAGLPGRGPHSLGRQAFQQHGPILRTKAPPHGAANQRRQGPSKSSRVDVLRHARPMRRLGVSPAKGI